MTIMIKVIPINQKTLAIANAMSKKEALESFENGHKFKVAHRGEIVTKKMLENQDCVVSIIYSLNAKPIQLDFAKLSGKTLEDLYN